MTRLASSISSSFMGFFGGKRGGQEESEESRRQEEAREAPVGRLIAAGQGVVNSPRHSSTITEASELSTSLQQLDDSEVSGDESEEKPDAAQVHERAKILEVQEPQTSTEKREETEKSMKKPMTSEDHPVSPAGPRKQVPFSSLDLSSSSSSSGKEQDQPVLARSMPLRTALPPPRQELVEVEGDIVEL
ncbi:unnamed protein product [Phytophthora fragariaefolia]|uniref:Unnamed protein product n=1 Tax=Phytophthora fragariaefolia TaxID=1490495 RepID=A0A9W7CZR9_9STRA|nr:unnamed protein product [Phytophthora fragariaefolia]